MTPEIVSTVLVIATGATAIIIELYVLSDLKGLVKDVRDAISDAEKMGDNLIAARITADFKADREEELRRKVEALKTALEKADKHRAELLAKKEQQEYDKDKEIETLKGQVSLLKGEIGTLRSERYESVVRRMRSSKKKKGPVAE
jgi:hypothetical protein